MGPHGRRCSPYNSAGVIRIALLKYKLMFIFIVYLSSASLLITVMINYTMNAIILYLEYVLKQVTDSLCGGL